MERLLRPAPDTQENRPGMLCGRRRGRDVLRPDDHDPERL